jgi:hypothetical protein
VSVHGRHPQFLAREMGNCSRRQGVQQQSSTTAVAAILTPQSRRYVQRKWRWAIKRVIVMLRVREAWSKLGKSLSAAKGDESHLAKVRRKVWAELGGYFNRPARKNLFGHLVRKNGILQLRT